MQKEKRKTEIIRMEDGILFLVTLCYREMYWGSGRNSGWPAPTPALLSVSKCERMETGVWQGAGGGGVWQ